MAFTDEERRCEDCEDLVVGETRLRAALCERPWRSIRLLLTELDGGARRSGRHADALDTVGLIRGGRHRLAPVVLDWDGLYGGGRRPSSKISIIYSNTLGGSSIYIAWSSALSPTVHFDWVVDEDVAVVGLARLESGLHASERLAYHHAANLGEPARRDAHCHGARRKAR